MATITPIATLTTSQLQTLQNFTAAENFPAGHFYLSDQLNQLSKIDKYIKKNSGTINRFDFTQKGSHA